jgi:Zn-dependent protease
MLLNLISYITSGDQTWMIYGLVTLLLRLPAVLLALSIHEAAHGWMAYKLGDPTARNLGRITINPFKHLNPIGAISMLLFGIGWANPVPIHSRYFKKPKRDMALTAVAGPVSNLLQALAALLLLFVGTRLYFGQFPGPIGSVELAMGYFSMILNGSTVERLLGILFYLLWIYATLNIVLAIFNLIPIPPFDGSRLAFIFLPDKIYFGLMKYERITMFVFLFLFYFLGDLFGTVFEFFIDLAFKIFSFILMI